MKRWGECRSYHVEAVFGIQVTWTAIREILRLCAPAFLVPVEGGSQSQQRHRCPHCFGCEARFMEPRPWAAGVLPAVLGAGLPSSLCILRAEGVVTLCGDRSHVTSRGIGALTLHVRKRKCLRAALHS